MQKEIKILVTSVGRRTQLLKYFKKELGSLGKLIAADCSNLAPALYIADKQYIVPRIDHPDYIHILLNICKEEKVTGILSLIDPELSLLARFADEFQAIGVKTIVSPYDECERWFDKYSSAIFMRNHDFNCAETYNTIQDFEKALGNNKLCFPVFIKPRKGSASLNINKAKNLKEAKIIFDSSDDMLIQEFLDGQEFGVDVYVDLLSKEIISIFIKEKLAMRAGETDKARSFKSAKLFQIVKELVSKTKLVGPIDIDVFEINGEYYISEINPRFGGGYPLAYECNVNFPKYIINNLKNLKNDPQLDNYCEDIYMIKHDELTIVTQQTLSEGDKC